MPHTLICLHVDVKCTDVFELKFAVKFFSFKVKCVINAHFKFFYVYGD